MTAIAQTAGGSKTHSNTKTAIILGVLVMAWRWRSIPVVMFPVFNKL